MCEKDSFFKNRRNASAQIKPATKTTRHTAQSARTTSKDVFEGNAENVGIDGKVQFQDARVFRRKGRRDLVQIAVARRSVARRGGRAVLHRQRGRTPAAQDNPIVRKERQGHGGLAVGKNARTGRGTDQLGRDDVDARGAPEEFGDQVGRRRTDVDIDASGQKSTQARGREEDAMKDGLHVIGRYYVLDVWIHVQDILYFGFDLLLWVVCGRIWISCLLLDGIARGPNWVSTLKDEPCQLPSLVASTYTKSKHSGLARNRPGVAKSEAQPLGARGK